MALTYPSDWKLAKQGSSLESMPDPDQSVDRSLIEISGVTELPSGRTVKDVMGRKRQWQFTFTGLRDTEFAVLEKYWDGTQGLGPFWLKDPLLTGNQLANIIAFTDTSVHKGRHDCTLTMRAV